LKNNRTTRSLRRPHYGRCTRALLSIIFCLQACTTVTTKLPDGSQTTRSIEEFEQYAESVFKRQNQATTRIGEILEGDLDTSVYTELEAAEERMLKKCAAINRIARQQMDQQKTSILQEIEVKQSIGACDYATQQVERIFDHMQ